MSRMKVNRTSVGVTITNTNSRRRMKINMRRNLLRQRL